MLFQTLARCVMIGSAFDVDITNFTFVAKPEITPGSIMIFLKHLDTSRQSLYGVGKTYVQRNAKVGDLNGYINEKMRWPVGTPLKLYEEIKPGMIELMKPKMTFAQSEIQDGDVICFQVEISDKE